MNTVTFKSGSTPLTPRICFCLLLIFCLAQISHGQTILDSTNENLESKKRGEFIGPITEQTAPMLFEEEFDDIGPQYLLVPGKPIHKWFSGLFDIQWLNSSNPTQAENDRKHSADLRVLTAQLDVKTPAKQFAGGRYFVLSGFRYQTFGYGNLSGDKVINGIPISENDFEAITAFSHINWTYKQWNLRFGLHGTQLNNDSGGSDFYHELVPSISLGYDYILGNNTLLTAEYKAAYYATTGQPIFTIRDDYNDRHTHAISLRLLHRITPKLQIQPNAQIHYAIYTNDPNGDREDTTYSIGLNMNYYYNAHVVLRIFTNYQKRHSNGLGIGDYENLDLGLGSSLTYKF